MRICLERLSLMASFYFTGMLVQYELPCMVLLLLWLS